MAIQEYEWIEYSTDDIKAFCGQKVNIPVVVRNIEGEKRTFKLKLVANFEQSDSSIIWEVDFTGNDKQIFQLSPESEKEINRKYEIDKNESKEIIFVIDTPKGGSIGDRVEFTISVLSEDGIHNKSFNRTIHLEPIIIAVKSNVGKELEVAKNLINADDRDLAERLETNPQSKREIMAIMSPYELRGYFYLETMHPDRIPYLARSMRNFKGVVNGSIEIGEISDQLTPKPAVEGLELGSFVELVKGPFKGEKARIMNIDHEKEEVTVQFIESAMLIPVKVRAEDIRVIESGKRQ
jgi:ribosomal protein L24p/L26e, archaeal